MTRLAILGGGAWGTALAQVAARANHEVLLWARDDRLVEQINVRRENPRFEMEIAKYLDASVTHLRQRPLDDVESVLAEKLLHETADSGAEVLGWSR